MSLFNIVLSTYLMLAASAALAVDLPGLSSLEGDYASTGVACGFAPRARFFEETDPTTDLVVYHLQLLREDGQVWSSREYRQLNQQPWYKIDLPQNVTVSGRSRWGRTGPDCWLSNEHRTCVGAIFPRCTGWLAVRAQDAVFEGGTLSLSTENDGTCVFTKM